MLIITLWVGDRHMIERVKKPSSRDFDLGVCLNRWRLGSAKSASTVVHLMSRLMSLAVCFLSQAQCNPSSFPNSSHRIPNKEYEMLAHSGKSKPLWADDQLGLL